MAETFDKGDRVTISGGEHAGAVGEVFWWGKSKFGDGMRAGVVGDDGEKYWVDAANLRLATGRGINVQALASVEFVNMHEEECRLEVTPPSPSEAAGLGSKARRIWNHVPEDLLAFYRECNGLTARNLNDGLDEVLIHGAADASEGIHTVGFYLSSHDHVLPHLIPLSYDLEDKPRFAVYCAPPWSFPIVRVDDEAFRLDAEHFHHVVAWSMAEFLAELSEVEFEPSEAYGVGEGVPWVFDDAAANASRRAAEQEKTRKIRARDEVGGMLTPPSQYDLGAVLRGEFGFPGAAPPADPTLVTNWRFAFSSPGGEVTRRRFEERLLLGRGLVRLLDEAPTGKIALEILDFLSWMNFVEGADDISAWAKKRAPQSIRPKAREVAGWISESAKALARSRPLMEVLMDDVVE